MSFKRENNYFYILSLDICTESFPEDEECTDSVINSCYSAYVKKIFRDLILDENRR